MAPFNHNSSLGALQRQKPRARTPRKAEWQGKTPFNRKKPGTNHPVKSGLGKRGEEEGGRTERTKRMIERKKKTICKHSKRPFIYSSSPARPRSGRAGSSLRRKASSFLSSATSHRTPRLLQTSWESKSLQHVLGLAWGHTSPGRRQGGVKEAGAQVSSTGSSHWGRSSSSTLSSSWMTKLLTLSLRKPPSHLTQEANFSRLYPQSCSFGH